MDLQPELWDPQVLDPRLQLAPRFAQLKLARHVSVSSRTAPSRGGISSNIRGPRLKS
jgi:hypothetical protein